MNRPRLASSVIWLLSPVSCLLLSAATPAPQSIFDGRTLAGWEGNPQSWRVEDGAITGTIAAGQRLAKNEFIYWKGAVADFELTAEFRLSGDPSANSGIMFRARKGADGHAAGYQADMDQGAVWLGRIYDEHGRKLLVERGDRVSIAPDGRRWSEKFGEPADFLALPKPAGGWNTYRILASASHVEVWINGTRVSVLDDHQTNEADLSGLIALQLHSGPGPVKVQFRNLQLTTLGRTTPPPPITAAQRAASAKAESIGVTRRNGDPPLRRVPGVDDLTRLRESPVLWHLRDNPAKPTAVANAPGQKLVAGMKLVAGFQAELIAAEPEVHQPIAFAFDERGRIWIAEAFSYPNKQPEGKGKDRIIILEDKDGDGAFETKKTFAEGLNLVSGLEVGFGGVWVGAAPHLLFIPDKNHDDVADGPPQILLDGWGFQDTHETLNSFTWGPDGWLYGCHGVFTHSLVGKPGAPADQRQKVRAAVWRYHPVRHEFEVFSHGGSNQWGLDFNAVGHLFMTHCRSFHGGGGTSYVIRNGHYWNQANNDYAPFISNRAPGFAPELKNFLMASARYDSGEGGAGKAGTTAVYGGHSHVGTMIYLGDNWPETYRDHLFTHNLHGHQINHQTNVRTGSAYETFHAGYDLSFVPDATYLPVDLQYGPDGAVYVVDWSDTQHCHNPNTELWDRTNGRLYRIAWGATYKPVKINLASASDAELAALHTHRNEWFVRVARRVLQERAATRAIDAPALAALRAQAADTTADVSSQLRALWTLHVTQQLDATRLTAALSHSSDVVRAWAVQLGTESGPRPPPVAVSASDLLRLAQTDPSAHVRLAVASAVPTLPLAARWPIAAALATHGEDANDRFLPKMVWYALASSVAADVPRALDLAARTPLPSVSDSIVWFAARTAEGRDRIAQRIGATSALPDAGAQRALRVLAFSLESEAGLKMPAAWTQVTARFGATTDNAIRGAWEQLSALFGDKTVLGPIRTRLATTATPLAERRQALDLLRRAGDTESTALLVKLLDDAELRPSVIPLLSNAADAPAVAAGLISRFAGFNATDRTAALAALTSKPVLALPLLRGVETGAIEKKSLTALHARQLRNLRDPAVSTALERVWGRTADSSSDAKVTIARLRDTFREAPLWSYDVKAGRQVFERLCAACHALDATDSAGKLGPNLNGTWRNGLDYFLENIVDPNAVVGTDFQLNLVTKRDGSVVSGMIEKESDTALIVRTMTESVNVPKTDVKSREVTTQSLMPAGLLEALPAREAVELLLFLTTEPK
ncbi:PVC-type heme-binding CxxCH protein [Horticoccus sp. 23ND18S-11]|uniref:PVC-type heme-binding CxxCH protein n=1 Tax=Horticoccus sp. 23ND18S-11 TaxID=3391832 RepID=UPI0039C9BE15